MISLGFMQCTTHATVHGLPSQENSLSEYDGRKSSIIYFFFLFPKIRPATCRCYFIVGTIFNKHNLVNYAQYVTSLRGAEHLGEQCQSYEKTRLRFNTSQSVNETVTESNSNRALHILFIK